MIKITPADKALADCLKLAADYHCQRCQTRLGEKHRGLHASHYVGRSNWSVRFHPDNVFVHCYGCHAYLGSRPYEFRQWVEGAIGEGRHAMIVEASRSVDRGRRARREMKAIATHYRQQLRSMQERRKQGETTRFEIEAYD